MNKRFAIAVCILAFASVAMAQNERDPANTTREPARNPREAAGRRGRPRPAARSAEPQEVRVYALKYAKAADLASTIASVTQTDTLADERTNSVIVMAGPNEQEQVANLIETLDTPQETAGNAEDLAAIPVHHRDITRIRVMLMELFQRELKISSDETGRRLLVRGSAENVAKARDIVATTDVALPKATIEIAFFQIGSDDSDFSMDIPDDLIGVARQIEQFGQPRLIGRMMTAAIEGEPYSLSGEIAGKLDASLEGSVQSVSERDAVRLSLHASLALKRSTDMKEGPRNRNPVFRLNTTLVAPRGDFVVLGSAPLGWKPGEAVLLVVRIPQEPR